MSNGEISTELAAFIHAHIHSIEQLEVLQALVDDPAQRWTAEEMADNLYIQLDSATARLHDLEAAGFCVVDNAHRYRYDPSLGDRDRLVRELLEAYRIRRVSIITLIFSKPVDQIDSFSEAFRFKRKEGS